MSLYQSLVDLVNDHGHERVMSCLVEYLTDQSPAISTDDMCRAFFNAATRNVSLARMVQAWHDDNYARFPNEFDDLFNQLMELGEMAPQELMPMIVSFYINTGGQHEYIDMMSDAYRASFPECYTPAPNFTWAMACENRWTEGYVEQLLGVMPTLSETKDVISNITRQMCGR